MARLFSWSGCQIENLTLEAQLISFGTLGNPRRFFDEVLPISLPAPAFPKSMIKLRPSKISRTLRQIQGKVPALPESPLVARGEEGMLEILTQRGGGEKDLDATAMIPETAITPGSGGPGAGTNSGFPGASGEEPGR